MRLGQRLAFGVGCLIAVIGAARVAFADYGNCKAKSIYVQEEDGSWTYENTICDPTNCPVEGGAAGVCMPKQIGTYWDAQGHLHSQGTCVCRYPMSGGGFVYKYVYTSGPSIGELICAMVEDHNMITGLSTQSCLGDCDDPGSPICKITNIAIYTENGRTKKSTQCGCAAGD